MAKQISPIYQIQIALKGSKPKIWRRVLVPSDTLLYNFHKIIQTTMGWTNSHLHQFVKGNVFYSVKYPDDEMWSMNDIDYRKKKLRIRDLLTFEKEKIIYEYDFGDSWQHEIILEKILPPDNTKEYPICVSGKRNCPPEDCGGVWGYAEMLEILSQPDHEDYDDTLEWLGEEFDPEYFNKDEINELLRTKNYGCLEF